MMVAPVVISSGQGETALPTIAGGYDATGPARLPRRAAGRGDRANSLPATAAPLAAAVNGPSFDVKQSGEFVNFSDIRAPSAEATPEGRRRRRYAAQADRRRQLRERQDGQVRRYGDARQQGRAIAGTLDGVQSQQTPSRPTGRRQSQKPRAPGDIAQGCTRSRRARPASAGVSSSTAAARATRC